MSSAGILDINILTELLATVTWLKLTSPGLNTMSCLLVADTRSEALEIKLRPDRDPDIDHLGPVKRPASMLTSMVADSRGSSTRLGVVTDTRLQPGWTPVISMRTA